VRSTIHLLAVLVCTGAFIGCAEKGTCELTDFEPTWSDGDPVVTTLENRTKSQCKELWGSCANPDWGCSWTPNPARYPS